MENNTWLNQYTVIDENGAMKIYRIASLLSIDSANCTYNWMASYSAAIINLIALISS